MDEVAESSSYTSFPGIQSTTCFSKVRNRAEFAIYRSCRVPSCVEGVACGLGIFLVLESCVDVADEIYSENVLAITSSLPLTTLYGTHDHCYCHTPQPPPVLRTCTSHRKNPRRTRQSGSVAVRRSFYSSDQMLGSGRGWGEGSSASTRA